MRSRISGFTLIELIITILVMTILLGIGVPSYLQFKEDNVLLGAAQSLYSDIQLARSEAVKRDANTVSVRFFDVNDVNKAWCYRITDNSACDRCSDTADSCDIHGDKILRGRDKADFPGVRISVDIVSAGSATLAVSPRRSTTTATTIVFQYGTNTSKQVHINTNLLGRVLMCTPTTANGLTGIDTCS